MTRTNRYDKKGQAEKIKLKIKLKQEAETQKKNLAEKKAKADAKREVDKIKAKEKLKADAKDRSEKAEKNEILKAIEKNFGYKAKVARELKILQSSLSQKIKTYNLEEFFDDWAVLRNEDADCAIYEIATQKDDLNVALKSAAYYLDRNAPINKSNDNSADAGSLANRIFTELDMTDEDL